MFSPNVPGSPDAAEGTLNQITHCSLEFLAQSFIALAEDLIQHPMEYLLVMTHLKEMTDEALKTPKTEALN